MEFNKLIVAAMNPNRKLHEKLKTFRTVVRKKVKILKRIRIMLKPKTPRFAGWGMTSKHALPWYIKNSTDAFGLKFSDVLNNFKMLVRDGEFVLTQFQNDGSYVSDPLITLNGLSWRHYLNYWSATLAARFNPSSSCNFVEAGTCDGLTIKFAISALENEIDENTNYKIYLYDAWDAMKFRT